MINFFKKLFGKAEAPAPEAPYKVETPAPVVQAEQPVVADKAVEAVVKSVAKPAPKKQGAKKQGSNKPRGPRKPKAAKPAVK